MPEVINAKQLREWLQEVVDSVRHGARFTVPCRSCRAFDIAPVGKPSPDSVPLEADPLYGATPVGASDAGDAAVRHDEVLYQLDRCLWIRLRG